METYEEEGESPDCVINYYTVDGNNVPVSFSILPLLWSEDETPGNWDTQIFLCGTALTGQKMYKKIIAWRPEISYALPVIYVLSKNKLWMQLQRPRRSFEDENMSTLITVHCLHFLKWNLNADGSALWTHLHKAFSTDEVPPSKRHLLGHLPVIQEAAKRDKDLAKSELLPTLLLETRICEANRATKKITFEADSQKDYAVCLLCDNGGELLCCEDKCLRFFHPNINAGVDSCCESLGYSDAQVEAIRSFVCNNCQYQQHQCFVCGKLGSSDKSSAPEVFQCANADCGHFYHPNCVAELLQPCDTLKTKELQLNIHSGETFVCPAHKCSVCMKGEDKTVHELQFAMCRRCPKAYHRKCLPREITFRGDEKNDQRAWDGLLAGRIIIYCMEHEILSDIGTPKRDHIIFPNVEGKMLTTSGLLSSKEKLIRSRGMGNFTLKSPLQQRFKHTGVYRGHPAYATITGEEVFRRPYVDRSKLSTSQRIMYLASPLKQRFKHTGIYRGHSMYATITGEEKVFRCAYVDRSELSTAQRTMYLPSPLKQRFKHTGIYRGHSTYATITGEEKVFRRAYVDRSKLSTSQRTMYLPSPLKQRFKHTGIYRGHSTYATITGEEKVFRRAYVDRSELSTSQSTMYLPSSSRKISDYPNQSADKFMKVKGSSRQPAVDVEHKLRMLKLIEDSMSSFNMEESLKGEKSSSLYSSNVRIAEDKTFTEGKDYVKAVQTALKILNLNDGEKLEDAKAVCEPQEQLNINLAPFGRHFTKVSKLELIVDKLKWYVQDGDTIVDFCCGANDFSCLMRERLQKMGKICFFKNYDLFTPKKDFNFEQKDWMTIPSKELPAGSNLIMGLNPPFGVNGNLANKFIDKALTFKPKLLILIVPIETERLDRKKESPYDNIWEDQELLSGKAFYLPGSVDVHSKPLEQHNNLAPPLYLWSRPDWTSKHKTIAETCGHHSVIYEPIQMGKMDVGENHDGMYEDMEVDLPIQKSSFDWNLNGSYPSNNYMTGMQHSSGVSDAAAIGMQHSYVALDAMQGVYHEVLSQHSSVASNDVEGVHHGASPCQYPTEPYLYPELPGF